MMTMTSTLLKARIAMWRASAGIERWSRLVLAIWDGKGDLGFLGILLANV